MTNKLNTLAENVDNMQECMGSISRKMDILIKNQKEILGI